MLIGLKEKETCVFMFMCSKEKQTWTLMLIGSKEKNTNLYTHECVCVLKERGVEDGMTTALVGHIITKSKSIVNL